MSIQSIGGGAASLSHAQELLQNGPGELQGFEQALEQAQQQSQGDLIQQAASDPAIDMKTPAEQEALYAQKVDEAKQPGGVEKLLSEAHADYAHLNELIDEMQSGKTFRPQELIGLQAEVSRISLQVETTTKVIGQVVSSVKSLMNQQV